MGWGHRWEYVIATDYSWGELAAQDPALAATGRTLLYADNNLAAAFLATVAPDGGPRVHPVYPVLADDELWLFIVNMSPKYRDLKRNGRYALHTLPTPAGGEEFHLRGFAAEIDDPATRKRVQAATGHRQGNADFEALFRARFSSVLHTHWDHWNTEQAWPTYRKWPHGADHAEDP